MASLIDFTSFSINVLDKRINCTIPEDVFMHDVFTLFPQVANPDASFIVKESDRPLLSHIETKNGVITLEVSGKNVFNMNMFRSYIGFLIHYLTPAVFLHACGIYSILRKKGILLIGHEGSGKTALSKEIPSSYIIDDDQILINEDELLCIGKKAAYTIQKRKSRKVVYENSEYLCAKLGLIFALTKKMEGGAVKKIPAESILADPSLVWHHNLCTMRLPENYCEGKSIPDVPAFLLGTNGNKNRTIEALLGKIDALLAV